MSETILLAERYYVTLGLWHEPSVCLLSVCDVRVPWGKKQEAQLSLTNRAMLVCKVVEVWQDVLSEYVDKKFSYICYRWLIRHE